jgi:phosphoglucosamine mutase
MVRKLFGTDGVRGKVNVPPMVPETILKLGQAAACIFAKSNHKRHKVIIAKDTRVSGYIFEYALTSGLCSMGVDVYQIGPMPTPALAHLVKSFAADAGIMITASHNPIDDNGIKFFSKDGYKLPDTIEEEMEKYIFENKIQLEKPVAHLGKAHKIEDARGRYVEFVKHSIKNRSLKGYKIVLDCANGAAYKVAPLIFQELGAEVILINATPDGLNINNNCGALHPEMLQKKVLETKADIGIALDGDADRVVIIDENGGIVDGDKILAIAAVHFKNKGKLEKDTVVTTVMANAGFDEAMRKHGITVIRTAVGDRYVIEEMHKNGYTLGGEQAGHIIFGKYTTTGDGTLAGLQILSMMQQTKKTISQLAQVMTSFPQILLNVKVKEKKPLDSLPKLCAAIKAGEKELSGKGRILVRYSGTENLCRVMVEGKDQKQINKIAESIVDAIKEEEGAEK